MPRPRQRETAFTRVIPVTNEIVQFMHCARCLPYKPPAMSARDWANLEVGFTTLGLQVWCIRCNVNVVHVDFQGRQHPANTRFISPPDTEPTKET